MRDITDLQLQWSGPPLSMEDVRAFERHFGVVLPPEYVDLLSQANGGEILGADTFDYTLSSGEVISSAGMLARLHQMLADSEDIAGVWNNTELLREMLKHFGLDTNAVAIGMDGSVNQVFLDMTTEPPSVRILYLDPGGSAPKAADSFEQFINDLHHHPDIRNEGLPRRV